QTGSRMATFVIVRKAVQDVQRPACSLGTKFEHGAVIVGAAKLRRTVKISRLVDHHGREKWIRPIRWPAEAVEPGLVPASAAIRRNFKHDATSISVTRASQPA